MNNIREILDVVADAAEEVGRKGEITGNEAMYEFYLKLSGIIDQMDQEEAQVEEKDLSPEVRQLRTALTALLERYVGLVNSGDCGNWDPETEFQVITARAALAATGTQEQ